MDAPPRGGHGDTGMTLGVRLTVVAGSDLAAARELLASAL